MNQGPDSSMAEQLAVAKEKLDKEHERQEQVREAQLEVCPHLTAPLTLPLLRLQSSLNF